MSQVRQMKFPLTHAWVLSHFNHVWLYETLWTVAHQAPLYMAFSRQEYWSGLPYPPLRDLPSPGTEPMSPALPVNSSPLSHQASSPPCSDFMFWSGPQLTAICFSHLLIQKLISSRNTLTDTPNVWASQPVSSWCIKLISSQMLIVVWVHHWNDEGVCYTVTAVKSTETHDGLTASSPQLRESTVIAL